VIQANKNRLVPMTVGLDLGDKKSHYCVVDSSGAVAGRKPVSTTPKAVRTHFARLLQAGASRVALEVGTQSPWVSRLLAELGFEVVVANAREVASIAKSSRKSDRVDAELLARLARVDPQLLRPIQHRGPKAQADLAALRSRAVLVATRTQLINHVRGSTKPWGLRLPRCSAACFHKKVPELLPKELAVGLTAVVEQIASLTAQILRFDQHIEHLCEHRYPETKLLRQVKGVGPVTALTFVLTIESPDRINKPRNAGAYVGLVPKRRQSGDSDPQLGITKAGDVALRALLVNCAHYILGPFGQDSDLRRLGLRVAAGGGQGAKKRAVIAVARKLSVLLLRLWQTGEVYEPLRNTHAREAKQIAAGQTT